MHRQVFAFIQSLLTQFAIDHGLGQHTASLSIDDFSQYNQLTYAAHLILILVLALSKVSTCLLIRRITHSQYARRNIFLTLIAVGVWGIFALLGIALQCPATTGVIMYSIVTVNILTDLALVAIPLAMVWDLQIAWNMRLQVFAVFASRMVVVVTNVSELVFLPTYLRSTDPTWTIVNVDICDQLMIYLSIVAACMPSLSSVLKGLDSGLNDVHLSREALALPARFRGHTFYLQGQ